MLLKVVLLLSLLLLKSYENETCVRSCRQGTRNDDWFAEVWGEYSDKCFKETLQISCSTFRYLLKMLGPYLQKRTMTEEAISPEERLAIALYKLARGDLYFALAEMSGRGVSTVRNITVEVCKLIVDHLWQHHVRFPASEEEMKKAIQEMDMIWQATGAFSGLDGCHIPIKCPSGGGESRKEYYNFKNFYSVVLMGLLDAKYRFIWASAGLPGSTHDSMIFQTTKLYNRIVNENYLPRVSTKVNGHNIPPIILGDSAFPHHSWLQKPYSNANLSEKQAYFNYRLSRGRMVTECAYGQMKGRWRVLYKKCESEPESMKDMILACVVLHNICIDLSDRGSKCFDARFDQEVTDKDSSIQIREHLLMFNGHGPTVGAGAASVGNIIADHFLKEKNQS